MANWKKVIVSGSNAVLAEVTASGGFKGDGSGITGISADSLSNALTVDDATIQLNSGTTFNGSAARTISVKDGGVDADALATSVAGTGLAGGGGTALSVDLNEFSAATVNVANDSIVLIDADDSNASKKESVADLVSGVASTGLSAGSGQLSVAAAQTSITSVINSSMGKIGTDAAQEYIDFGSANKISLNVNNSEKLSVDSKGVNITGAVTASNGITGSFIGDGSGLTGVTGEVNIDALSALGSAALHQTQDHFIFSDNGTEKKITFSNLQDAVFADVSSDVTIAAGGAATIANDAVNNDKLANMTRGTIKVGGSGNVPTDLNAKTDGQMLIGDGTDVVMVDISGDIAIANDGDTTIQANAVHGSMLNSDVAGAGLSYGSNVLSVDLSGESAVTIGGGTSEVTIGDNLTITGDLTVNGDRNIVSTTNLLVEDKFVTLASGSSAAGDGGIVVQTAAAGTGAPIAFDSATRRWAIGNANTLSGLDTSFDSTKGIFDYIVGVSGSALDPAAGSAPIALGATNHQYGQMHVNTTTGDIFIYS